MGQTEYQTEGKWAEGWTVCHGVEGVSEGQTESGQIES